MEMHLHPTAFEIAGRLVLTLIACILVGLNRESASHSAGLRTTVLVGLAACIATSQANILLGLTGKTPDMFTTMDVMRLPLGILTGVGFIGGGVILKRGNLVSGVTTAATIWAVSVIGICFGGGQLILGSCGTVLIVLTLSVLRWIDIRIPRDQRAQLIVASAAEGPPFPDMSELLRGTGIQARFQGFSQSTQSERTLLTFDLHWRQPEVEEAPLDFLKNLEPAYDVRSFEVIKEAMH
ncbi:MgtC/SapB family protein [Hyphomicrobium sp.]|uniref:MgtC/SapB family protein n=1 Tax=Hyphomicrobium sp. TaxID=82 RepID=UPI000F9EC636|nr:MgtC/SapB family protein [Hyphomicrobium sp.]RUP11283.1 MAG: MgtC/SapB family protein [Hyphomicrobium sp.]